MNIIDSYRFEQIMVNTYRYKTMLFRVIVLLLIVNMLLIGSAGCEVLAPIQIENKTSEVLTIYIDEYHIGDVEPNDKIKNDRVFAGNDWYLIEAYGTQGDIVYSHKFSDEELKVIDRKVVIPPS